MSERVAYLRTYGVLRSLQALELAPVEDAIFGALIPIPATFEPQQARLQLVILL